MSHRYVTVSVLTLALTAPCIVAASKQSPIAHMTLQGATSHLSSLPLSFTQNKGQWPDSILYRASVGGATMWFTPTGAHYQFTQSVASIGSTANTTAFPTNQFASLSSKYRPDSLETMMIGASFVGSNPTPEMHGDNLREYKCNYFLGNDRSRWQTDVPNYSSIIYRDVYSGIDLKYYGDSHQMEYDFIISPGANYSQVKIRYEGAKSVSVNASGDLVVETQWGTVNEKAPTVYQMDGVNRITITGAYQILDSSSFGFSLGANYNRSLPTVIDPVLSYSTYLGGSSGDYGNSIAVDSVGSMYVTGYTQSSDFPAKTPYQGTFGGSYDAFVTKLSSSGSLVYSTYLGGGNSDYGNGIAVNSAGTVYVTGSTRSGDFPVTTLAPFTTGDNVFFAKLSSAGNSLIFSTYMGSGFGNSVAVDTSGAAYFTGGTDSTGFTTLNPVQGAYGGAEDAFVTKLSPAGNIIYSTFLGGGGTDEATGIAVDSSGAAYVTGWNLGSGFPTMNPYQVANNGLYDVFVTKLSSTGNSLIYSTYLGGSFQDYGYSIAVNSAGEAFVAGATFSGDFPTLNPYQGTLPLGFAAFVTKLSSSGSSLVYSTFLSGSAYSRGTSIGLDASGAAYITGSTIAGNFPTVNPLQGTNGGGYDAFVSELSSAGSSLIFSTYLGGSSDDVGEGIVVDKTGTAYVTGYTYSGNFPTVSAFDGSLIGSIDAFVSRIGASCCVGKTGNVNASGIVDLSDLSALVSYLTGGGFVLPCPAAANVNATGIVDLSDLSALVSYLTGGGFVLPNCP